MSEIQLSFDDGRMETSAVEDVAHARFSDPETSHEAAEHASAKIRESQQAVLSTLRLIGKGSDEQIAAAYVGPVQSPSGLRTRRNELVRAGYVYWTGEWDTNKYGNRTRIWACTLT